MAKNSIQPGDTFGRLRVIAKAAGREKRRESYWLCACTCGGEKVVSHSNLRGGKANSCGCLARETSRRVHYKHGSIGTPEYWSWEAMKDRCRNPRSKYFGRYGGRGIKVCDRWLDFNNFLADMGPRPSPAHTLDRINNDGNYEPGNCRWATQKEQQRNRSSNRLITYMGETRALAEWCEIYGVKMQRVLDRLNRGWDFKDALLSPLRKPPIFRGEDYAHAKVTEAQVKEMREKYASGKCNQKELAAEYGLSKGGVWAIVRRRTWSHV